MTTLRRNYMIQVLLSDGSVHFEDYALLLEDKDSFFDGIRKASPAGSRVVFKPMDSAEVLREELVEPKGDHSLVIRVLSQDGELLSVDNDFHEDGAYDFFSTVVLFNETGDVVQLIDTSDDRVLAEEIVGN